MALHTISQTLKAGAPGAPFLDSRTKRAPAFYHAAPLDWIFALRDVDGQEISGIADGYAAAVLKVLATVDAAEPLLTLTVTPAADDVTFSLSAAQTTLVEEGDKRPLWAVVYLLTSGGVAVPVGAGKIECVASGAQAAGDASDPESAALTGAEVQALIDDAIQELPRVQTVTARDIEALRPDVWRDHTTLNINSQNLAAVSWGDRSTNRDTAAVGSAPAVSASGRTNGKCHFAFTAGNYFTTAGTVLKDVFVVCKPAAETGLAVVLSKPSNFYLAACTGSAKRPLYAGPGGQVDGDTLGYRGEFGITEPRIVTFQATDVGGLMSWVSPQQIVAWGANGHRQIYRKYLSGSVVALDFTRIGRYNGGTGDYAGDMICVLGFARCLTQSERAKVMRYLAATYGITLPTYYNMVGLGDSILAHQGVSEAYGLMPRLLGNGGPGLLDATKWSGICGAVGGNRTYDILATNLGTLAAFADDAVNVALIWVGTNNNSTTTVEVALADVAQILAEVRARNGYAVLMAMLPTQAGSESFRIPYNAGLAALAAADEEGTVYFFDGDTLAPDIYDPSPASWSTYYQDGLHPNAAGFGYLAPILAGEIGGFLDGKEPLTLDVATVVVPSGGGGGGTGEAPAASSGFLTFTADDGEAYRVPAEQV